MDNFSTYGKEFPRTNSQGGFLRHHMGGLVQVSNEPPRSAVKSADSDVPAEYQGWVEGYLVSWGSTRDTDLQGEFFTPRTEFCLEWFKERPVLYHHGMDETTGLKMIGAFKTIKVDEIGLWVQAQLDLRDKYAVAVYDMVAAKQFGWSSGSVDHLVKIGENGEILVWPLIEGSITPTPAQPAKTAVRRIKGIDPTMQVPKITVNAYKSILRESGAASSEYLRGLDWHLANTDGVDMKHAAAKTFSLDNDIDKVRAKMAPVSDSAWYISRAVAKALGIKDVTEDELTAVANEVSEVVEDEVTAAAAQALEDEAAQQSYRLSEDPIASSYRGESYMNEADLNTDEDSIMTDNAFLTEDDPVASYRARRRRALRNAALQNDDIGSVMMDEISAAMEDEAISSQAARAMRRRAWKRAIRNNVADGVDGRVDLGELAYEDARPLAGDTLPGGKYWRAYRNAALQNEALMNDSLMNESLMNEALMNESLMNEALMNEGLVEPTAASYRARRRAMRNAALQNEALMNEGLVEPTAASYRARRRAMRNAALQNEALMNEALMGDEPVMGGYMNESLMNESLMNEALMNEGLAAPTAASYRARRRAMRNAALQNEALMGDESLANEGVLNDVATASYRRGFRSGLRSAYSNEDSAITEAAAVQNEHQLVATQTDNTDAVEDAVAAYRSGYRRGLKRAIRQIEEETKNEGLNSPASASYRGYGYRNNGLGLHAGYAEGAVQPAATPTEYEQAPNGYVPISEAEGPDGNTKRFRRGMRGYGYRNNGMMNEPVMGGYMNESMMNDALMNDALMNDALMNDALMNDALMNEPVMGGYMNESMMNDALMNEALMTDPYRTGEPVMGDPVMGGYMNDSVMNEGVDPVTGKYYRQQRPQAYRSADPYAQARYWRNRAEALSHAEAPGQRAFKSLSVRDVADRPGAYQNAFKSYLKKGLGLMNDTEKYVLQGKGKARWENTTFSFDSATKSVKTYSSGSDASVGFLVPEDWVNELNKNVMTQTVMAPECRTRTTTSDRIVQPNLITTDARRAHGAQVRWPGESPASNAEHRTNEDQYSQITIPIHVMLISLASTNSALEDSTFNLEEEINEAFAEAVAVTYDQLIWGGDGQGKLQGIVVNDSVTMAESTGIQSVGGFVPSGSPDGLVTADTLKTMLFHLPQGYRQRAKWYMNSNTGLEVATLKDGEGNYLIDQRDESLRSVGVPDRLLGKPIVYNEWASDILPDNYPIVLADLTRGYVIGRRVEFSIRRFDDSNYAESDQVLFLGRARLGGQVLQPAAFKAMKIAAATS